MRHKESIVRIFGAVGGMSFLIGAQVWAAGFSVIQPITPKTSPQPIPQVVPLQAPQPKGIPESDVLKEFEEERKRQIEAYKELNMANPMSANFDPKSMLSPEMSENAKKFQTLL